MALKTKETKHSAFPIQDSFLKSYFIPFVLGNVVTIWSKHGFCKQVLTFIERLVNIVQNGLSFRKILKKKKDGVTL